MSSTVYVSPAWFAITAAVAIFAIVYPLILGVIVRKQLGVSWKYFWFGALVFLVFQLLTRIPIITVIQDTVLTPLLHSSAVFVWIWLVILSITAGLFEEVGRYIGYQLFLRREPRTWSKAVMFGLGHGGLESMVLVGGSLLLTLLNIVILSATNLNSLPVAQRHTVIQQFAAINEQPVWLPLLAAWERLWTVPLQVALAVIVLQVFRRHQISWLFLAILLHALVDFVTVAILHAFGQSPTIELLVEGIICAFGLLSLWIIWRLREPGLVLQW